MHYVQVRLRVCQRNGWWAWEMTSLVHNAPRHEDCLEKWIILIFLAFLVSDEVYGCFNVTFKITFPVEWRFWKENVKLMFMFWHWIVNFPRIVNFRWNCVNLKFQFKVINADVWLAFCKIGNQLPEPNPCLYRPKNLSILLFQRWN